jgi:uncharacterized protein with HEPN domain
MLRNDAALLDIVQAGKLILQFAQGLSREQLDSDLRTQSAVLYQIIAKANEVAAYYTG